MAEYFNIGKLVAVHGLKGELLLAHELGKKTGLKDLKAVFIEGKKNEFIPWFIETAKSKSADEIYLKLEGIDSRESALKLLKKNIWITADDHKKFASKNAPSSLIGYNIINQKDPLGEILEVIEQPHQILCRIEMNGKEVLIPLHEGSLKKIDHKKQQVMVELPEGLLEIYL